MEITQNVPNGLILSEVSQDLETVSMSLGGTAATITDTTTYPVAAQATKTEKVTVNGGTEQTVTFTTAIQRGYQLSSNSFPVSSLNGLTLTIEVDGGAAQTVTFSGSVTTAAHVVSAINAQLAGATATAISTTNVAIMSDSAGASSAIDVTGGTATALTWATKTTKNTAAGIASELAAQLEGVKVSVVAGQIVLTTDSEGAGSSIAIGTGTTDMTWGSPTAGTGQSGAVEAGTLLARNTSSKKLTVYSDSGSTGENEPVAVMPYDLTWTSAGDKVVSVIKAGKVAKNMLKKHDDATAIDTLVFDKLHKNSGVVAITATDVSVYSN